MQLDGPDFLAPAKLNLFLHVIGRRADGYHLLQSAFTLIDHADRLRFRIRDDGAIHRVNAVAGVPEEEDLAIRAARLLQASSGTGLGADIELEKRIPMGGGLGGGSSDAATVLLALDRLWGTNLGRPRLRELGAQLGADIPFFIFGRAAWVEGVGDVLRPLEVPPRWYVVLVPPTLVPTPEIFRAPELTRNTEALKIEDFSARLAGQKLRNDLQPVVLSRYPEVRRHLEWLASQGEARMTGSGGCVFAGYDSREQAERALAARPASMQGFVARGIEQHPLGAE
ncbi:4-(cytidine 5'-diphospho)-2-C-methyl-D-erythritol kinase [Usitatibacter palustris]|uniref:4-diphosphocytidyl-2-C-methyl-D-erythritol kinase n=1 Tax=Usitatibacter palustris TaxID=2732487 RepID=A0A6M4H273_9PROT|nr:4-(cytidine 5'-diphospho)-2-C-methyl-D-erythritol kinase [Usitatibacter palustris]QJR13639.1 4-diphosphocytidyl-2-C-methyl-D-erythritol kinase [Usitatibacter palustris]